MDKMKFEDRINIEIEKINNYIQHLEKIGCGDLTIRYLGKADGLLLALKLFNDSLTTLEKLGRNLD